MNLTRRELLAAGVGLGVAELARAQAVGRPFTIALAPVPLNLTGPVGIGIYATAPCTVETRLATAANETLFSVKSSIDAERRSASQLFARSGMFSGPVTVQLNIFPSTSQRPAVAGVIDPSGTSSVQDLRRAAENALFVKTPTSQPGYFALTLKMDSDVQMTIKHVNPPGSVVRRRTDPNLTAGENHIPWDLRNDSGQPVPPEEYVATILAKPKMPDRSDMLFLSTVQVIK